MSGVSEIKREFELERMILFSDAVFAIAITLLIIDIKIPEVSKTMTDAETLHAFKPVIVHFGGFVISFIFIGVMWWRHLSIFRYLRDYDKGLVIRNLTFIFFIVCFPFVVSGFAENVHRAFLLPVFLYYGNIAFTVLGQFLICHYIFIAKKQLCIPGKEEEKKYLYMSSLYSAVIFLITLVALVIIYIISNGDFNAVILGLYILPVLLIVSRRKLKKYKPTSIKNKF